MKRLLGVLVTLFALIAVAVPSASATEETRSVRVVRGTLTADITASRGCALVRASLIENGRVLATTQGRTLLRVRADVAPGTVSLRLSAPGCAPRFTVTFTKTPRYVATGTSLSGASGNGVPSGEFGRWRGSPVTIAGTWNDSYDAQTAQWSVQPGAEYGSWSGDLDIAVGAIYRDRGQTWAAAARGAYDSRWRAALNAIKAARGSRSGTLHLRFAHEFNGDWTPWAVHASDTAAFITAWRRFHTLQEQILPDAKLVLCPNDASSGSLGLDWRRAFPGTAYVDEMAVDSYNQYPFVTDARGFARKINAVDGHGAPAGVEQHRLFARSKRLPLAISEWSSNASLGDGAAYMRLFRAWLSTHAGHGAGQVPYDILFNVGSYNSGVFQVYPNTRMPQASAAYAQLF